MKLFVECVHAVGGHSFRLNQVRFQDALSVAYYVCGTASALSLAYSNPKSGSCDVACFFLLAILMCAPHMQLFPSIFHAEQRLHDAAAGL